MKKYTRIISLLLVVVFMTSLSSRVDAAEMERKIVVNGRGTISVKPDIAEIRFTSLSRDKNQKVAVSNNAKKVDKIIKGFKANGIKDKDMKTESLYVSEDYNHDSGTPKLSGYIASNTVVITLRDLSKLSKMIDLGVELGADSLDMINYKSSKAEDIYNDALALAVKNAKKKADVIALSTGNQIKSIRKITEQSSFNNIIAESPMEDSMGGAKDTPVIIGDMKIEATVEIEYIF